MGKSMMVIDVGSGTQDILVYQEEKNLENCVKMVVPSRTQIVAAQLRAATEHGKDVFLDGYLMGGGACTMALRKHLAAGLNASATPAAARTFNDSLAEVEQMGVNIVQQGPEEAERIWLGDVDTASLKQALSAFGQDLPEEFVVAVQDHGYSETESNRVLRFRLWDEFVLSGGDLKTLIYDRDIPAVYTRMRAVREIIPNSVVTDTGVAALLGIMADPAVQARLEQGVLAVNMGNSHTLAAAIKGNRVYGFFEQHTGLMDLPALEWLITQFQQAQLTNADVFNQGGHGATLHPAMGPGWEWVVVTGPRRSMAKSLGWYEAAPYGDMMLTGCFGLLAGVGKL